MLNVTAVKTGNRAHASCSCDGTTITADAPTMAIALAELAMLIDAHELTKAQVVDAVGSKSLVHSGDRYRICLEGVPVASFADVGEAWDAWWVLTGRSA